MLINENGLVRAIKKAYKAGGYTVNNLGDTMAIYTDAWFIKCNRAILPRKVLAVIVEHMGMIPELGAPVSVLKGEDPQQVMEEIARTDLDGWCTGERSDDVTMVPVIMQGYQIFQTAGGGTCWGCPLGLLNMIERDMAEHGGADVVDNNRLLWTGDGEAVAICTIRKATSSWAKEWERAVWNALEGVDLNKEEV